MSLTIFDLLRPFISLVLGPSVLTSQCRFVFSALCLLPFLCHLVPVSLPIPLTLSLSLCVSLGVYRFSLRLSRGLCYCLCSLCLPLPVSPCPLLHLVHTFSLPRPPARGRHRPAPELRWTGGAGLGSGLQAPPVPPLVLVPLLSSQPPRVFVSLALTRPLCLSPAAPAPPHPHLPLHIPRADWGSW